MYGCTFVNIINWIAINTEIKYFIDVYFSAFVGLKKISKIHNLDSSKTSWGI